MLGMLEDLVFGLFVHLSSTVGLLSDEECYFVYLSFKFRSLFITVVIREIKGLINDLKSLRKEDSFRDSMSGSVGGELEEGFEELVEGLVGFTLAAWA